jgi:hypothetical protein
VVVDAGVTGVDVTDGVDDIDAAVVVRLVQ